MKTVYFLAGPWAVIYVVTSPAIFGGCLAPRSVTGDMTGDVTGWASLQTVSAMSRTAASESINTHDTFVDHATGYYRVTASGQTVATTFQHSLASGHSADVKCTCVGRVVTAGTGSSVGDSFEWTAVGAVRNTNGVLSLAEATDFEHTTDTHFGSTTATVCAPATLGTSIECVARMATARGTIGAADIGISGVATFR